MTAISIRRDSALITYLELCIIGNGYKTDEAVDWFGVLKGERERRGGKRRRGPESHECRRRSTNTPTTRTHNSLDPPFAQL